MSDLERGEWVHVETGARCRLHEATPGVYYVDRELMHRMMRELGHVPEAELPEPPADRSWVTTEMISDRGLFEMIRDLFRRRP